MFVRLKLEETREGLVATISQRGDDGKVTGRPSIFLVRGKEEAKQRAKAVARALGLKTYGVVSTRLAVVCRHRIALPPAIAYDPTRKTSEADAMQIRLGYELIYDCPQPTPMLLMLNVHYTRVSDMVVPDHLVTSPSIPIRAFRDGFGNWCSRIVAPAGRIRLSASGIVNDTGEPDVVASEAQQHAVEDLPDKALVFLLGSRYCETERLSDIAWSLFGKTPLGWGRVQAICDYVHQHIAFGYEHARASRTGWEAFCDRTGVCRDYAHLAIAFCRCMNIPARYCTGYLSDIGVPTSDAPMDFAAWFEAYVGGEWYTFDARNNIPRIGRVLIARGRDATDVAITTNFGPNTLQSFTVLTEEVAAVE